MPAFSTPVKCQRYRRCANESIQNDMQKIDHYVNQLEFPDQSDH